VGIIDNVHNDVTYVTDGGCTESPATVVRTSPAPPDDVTVPVATPISRSYISVVWRAAGRPNGPNIRYELARMKILQPLDSKSLPVLSDASDNILACHK